MGYDPSYFFLKKTKEWARQEIGDSKLVRFYEGRPKMPSKILRKNGERSFRAIMLLGNTLGYSSFQDDIDLLKDLHNIGDGKAIVVTHTENRDWRIRNFQPFIEYRFAKLIIHELWKLDLESSVFKGDAHYYEVSANERLLRLRLSMLSE